MIRIPMEVLNAYGYFSKDITAISGGLINQSYCVKSSDGVPIAALQRLHPIFEAQVNLDIEALTDVLANKGVKTPRLIRTLNGNAWIFADQGIWRAITWIDGQCFESIRNPSMAHSAAKLVGQFHKALDGHQYTFKFCRKGVHNTEAHFLRLKNASSHRQDSLNDAACQLRTSIFSQAESLPSLTALPERICHGDLKISNLLFDKSGTGICLIDLDTMGHQNIAYELGDALRSWGNQSGENTCSPCIDTTIVAACAEGYVEGSQALLGEAEIRAVIPGLEIICLELATRFCQDIFEDSYFGWDKDSYPSRRAHNLERARGQLALCRSIHKEKQTLQHLWCQAFGLS